MGDFTFSKHERVNKKKDIESLFAKGKAFNLPPLRVVYLLNPDQTINTHQVLISVPARTFKKAVDRNLLKRRLREAYRLNKRYLTSEKKMIVGFIYTAKETLPFVAIEAKVIEGLERVVRLVWINH
jgi:ribonuclease P protein component